MNTEDKINIDIFKVLTRSIAHSDELDIMADHLTQLLVGALDIKACTLFLLNPETGELERIKSFGLSIDYLNKGPVFSTKSVGPLKEEPIIIRDIAETDLLQYPEATGREGIGAIVSVPIEHRGQVIGSIRLYHHEVWDISERDLDSLLLFAESVGLAMMYMRVLNALWAVKGIVDRTEFIE